MHAFGSSRRSRDMFCCASVPPSSLPTRRHSTHCIRATKRVVHHSYVCGFLCCAHAHVPSRIRFPRFQALYSYKSQLPLHTSELRWHTVIHSSEFFLRNPAVLAISLIMLGAYELGLVPDLDTNGMRMTLTDILCSTSCSPHRGAVWNTKKCASLIPQIHTICSQRLAR